MSGEGASLLQAQEEYLTELCQKSKVTTQRLQGMEEACKTLERETSEHKVRTRSKGGGKGRGSKGGGRGSKGGGREGGREEGSKRGREGASEQGREGGREGASE